MRATSIMCLAFAVSSLAFTNPPRATLTDAEVVGIYIQVNSFDIEAALLARAQASSKSVRALASQVATDHLGVRNAAFDLAATCNVVPALPSSRTDAAIEHGRVMAKLIGLTGSAFDKAYLQHEVTFHRSAIDAVRQTLLASATCPALKTHFQNVLPALEHHASETEALARDTASR
jgi:putative membrane protein